MTQPHTYDIIVSGGGLAGKTAAIGLAKNGWNVAICAPQTGWIDTRTTALLWDSIEFFQQLDLWAAMEDRAFPLKIMRIVDGTHHLLRAPQVDFNAAEIDLPAFGFNLKNSDILEITDHALDSLGIISIDGMLKSASETERGFEVLVESNGKEIKFNAGFLVGADGRNSLVRNSLFPGERRWAYPQHAFVVDFEHELSTQFTSTEFHTESGPFTIVPHSSKRAGLVWLEKPSVVAELINNSTHEIEEFLEMKMHSFLGKIRLLGPPASFPIEGLIANTFGEGNAAIIGEAAHVFPPIGAQGFNLGIRDIKELIDTMKRHTNIENRGRIYHNKRKADIETRTLGVDLLNKSLLSEFLPNQVVRSGGLYALGKFSSIRKMAMKLGISPTFSMNS